MITSYRSTPDRQETAEWQWHQLGHMQVCTWFQTDNHASTPPLSFLQAGALSAAQPTASKHWRHVASQNEINLPVCHINDCRGEVVSAAIRSSATVCIVGVLVSYSMVFVWMSYSIADPIGLLHREHCLIACFCLYCFADMCLLLWCDIAASSDVQLRYCLALLQIGVAVGTVFSSCCSGSYLHEISIAILLSLLDSGHKLSQRLMLLHCRLDSSSNSVLLFL